MINDIFLRQLAPILSKKQILDKETELEAFAKDETHGLKPHLPELVVKPTTTKEVMEVVKLCNHHHIYLTPRGAGTGKSGGAVAIKGGVVIDFSLMNKIVEIDANNLTATVEPGVVLDTLKHEAKNKGLFYPPDPASSKWCTIGGNIAENASGPSAVKYGTTKDYLLGLKLIMATGELVSIGKKTHKGVAGFDLTSLICGSEGTLGLVVEATLKLIPMPKHTKTGLFTFADEELAAACVSAILQNNMLPRCIEYIDSTSLFSAQKQKIDSLSLSDAKAALIIEFDANTEQETLTMLEETEKIAKKFKLQSALIAQDSKQHRTIWDLRKGLSESTKKLAKYKISEDIVVPRTKIAHMVKKIRVFAKKHSLKSCAFGHAGDGSLHVQILFDSPNQRSAIDEFLLDLFNETINLGGTITGEHGVGLAKQKFLPLEQSQQVIALQKGIKQIFDPTGIFNPGKFLP